MDVTTEAITKILSLAPTGRAQIHGFEYEDIPGKGFDLVKPPMPPGINVTTLDGLVNLLEVGYNAGYGRKPSDLFVHVLDWQQVHVVPKHSDGYGQQPALIHARPLEGISGFKFNEVTSQEKFIIGLQTCFEKNADLYYLLDLASHIDATEKVVQEDTGVTQNVTLQRSQALGKEQAAVKGRVKLAPFRTFRELEQPESDFVFRVHPGGSCSLNEADGGAWKITAVGLIAEWLSNRMKTSTVEGVGDIPIIS
jgi:hypothetical protein